MSGSLASHQDALPCYQGSFLLVLCGQKVATDPPSSALERVPSPGQELRNGAGHPGGTGASQAPWWLSCATETLWAFWR